MEICYEPTDGFPNGNLCDGHRHHQQFNIYRGSIVTDAQGYATVQLPAYFEAINRDFRYQLTVIDSTDDFVLAKVVREIQNN